MRKIIAGLHTTFDGIMSGPAGDEDNMVSWGAANGYLMICRPVTTSKLKAPNRIRVAQSFTLPRYKPIKFSQCFLKIKEIDDEKSHFKRWYVHRI